MIDSGMTKRRSRGKMAAGVVAVLAALLLFAPAALAAWPTPQLVSTGTTTSNSPPQIALDSAGNPSVVWYGNDGSTTQVYYAENTGSGWTPQLVSTGGSNNNFSPQIELDAAGNPNVVWGGNDGSTYQVYYAKNTGGGWTPQLVSTGASTGNYVPQIALDSGGNPNVVWYGNDGLTTQIYYAKNTGGGWTPQKVSTGTTTGNSNPQIALDSVGNPSVVWEGYDGSRFQVYYAENTGSGWTPQLVSTGASTDNRYPQIALDSVGNPSVVWHGNDSSTYQVYYAEKTGGVWTPQKVSTGASTENVFPQIALDSGNPSVVWRGNDGSTYQVYYAENTGGVWTPQLVSTTSTGNFVPQIALDSVGNPSVVWEGYDGSTGQVYYAKNTGSGWTPQLVSTGASTGNVWPQIALDSGNPNVVWQGSGGSSNQVYYSRPATPPTVTTTAVSSITTTTADSGGNVTDEGGAGVTARGVCWSTSANPTTSDPKTTDGSGPGIFTSSITGLSSGHTYHGRAYATNSVGTSYGSDLPFTTTNPVPVVSSVSPSSGPPGTQVTISGSNFGSSQGSSTVTIGGQPAQVVSWSDTKIVVTVPEGTNGGPVVVTTAQGGSNTNKDFTVVLSTWYLAEGTNTWGFNTYITIENPNDQAVTAKLTYMDPNAPASGKGIAGTRTITLPPLSQTTVSSMSDIGSVDFSTKVECLEGKTIAVDRTMFWTGPGYSPAQSGYHSSIGATSPSKTWFLPEGSSNWGFETWTLVENPNPGPASVTLTYMTETQGAKPVQKTVPAYSRATYNMAQDIGGADSSIQVSSDVPVIAERSMYKNNRREGSCSVGATAPAPDYYLAEGATGYDVGFITYVLIQNPQSTTNNVTLTYQTQSGQVAGPSFTMAPDSRRTVRVNDQLHPNTNVSTQVHGSLPIIAERAMYWDNGTGTAFHASIGLDSPHMSFYLPDGNVSSTAETWTLVQNPNPGAVTVRVTYLLAGGGTPVSFTDEIPPKSRASYSMGAKIPSGRASIMVQSLDGARPIMVERSMYMNNRGGGTNTIGGFSD